MENLNSEEYELFKKFHDLEGNSNPLKIKALEKDINKYLKTGKKYSPLLMEFLTILKLYTIESEFSNFEYYAKITKAYTIAEPIVKRLTYIKKENLDLVDLVISQVILGCVSDIEVAQKLCEKALEVVEKDMSNSDGYKKIKFFYHYNMLNRALKAEFFEVDHDKELDRRKMIKMIFKTHLNKASEILEDKNSNVPKEYGYILNVRAAIMDRDSHEAMENLKAMKKIKAYKKLYNITRVELADYSFYPNFELVEEHYNLAVGVRVRKLRERLGVTISELSDKLGIAS